MKQKHENPTKIDGVLYGFKISLFKELTLWTYVIYHVYVNWVFSQVQTYYAEIPDFHSFQKPHGKFMCV